jgi:hypothetical protein
MEKVKSEEQLREEYAAVMFFANEEKQGDIKVLIAQIKNLLRDILYMMAQQDAYAQQPQDEDQKLLNTRLAYGSIWSASVLLKDLSDKLRLLMIRHDKHPDATTWPKYGDSDQEGQSDLGDEEEEE